MKEFITWALSVWPILTALGGVGILVSGWTIHHNFGKEAKPILSNRDDLFKAIQQLKETASEVIISSLSLSNIRERGSEPHQSFVNQFPAAFDKYREAQKELECQELIATEIFHDSINIFRTEINSCIQNPAPPEKVTNSLVVNVNTKENSNKLYNALNEVISKINEISQ